MRKLTLAAFLAGVLSLPLAACGQDDPAVKIYSPDESGVSECQADHPDQSGQCSQALTGAQEEQETTASHYTLDECLAQYGQSACQPRDNGSYFVPIMAGFMFGAALNGPVVYHPVYVNLSGQAYYGHTVLGTYRPGRVAYITPAPSATWTRTYAVRTVTIPRTTPVSPPSYNYGSPKPIERSGGFAGSAAVTRTAAPSAPAASPPSSSINRSGGFGGGMRSRSR